MKNILFRGFLGVIINNQEGVFFQLGKVLRKCDPISPLFFNLVVYDLCKMLQKAAELYLIKERVDDLVEGV
jgi:hypothetical protein